MDIHDADLSRETVERFVRSFEDCTLDRRRWTHSAHLVVGLWYVLNFGRERAYGLMAKGIERYNRATGRSEEERDGFRADVTREWIDRIAEAAHRHAADTLGGTTFRRVVTGLLTGNDAPSTRTWSTMLHAARMATPWVDESGSGDVTDKDVEVTRLLGRGAAGEDVVDELFGLVYEELCSIAARRMQSEREDHTLQATALVHEAYARLVRDKDMAWTSRRHFFGAAAHAMRRILVDHARYVSAQRRDAGGKRMTLSGVDIEDGSDPERMLALDEALDRLEREDPRAAELVRLRFFTGLGLEETAAALDLSVRTVTRELAYARARLHQLL